MKDQDFPFFLMLMAVCCLIMHFYFPGDITLLAGIGLAALSGIILVIGIFFRFDSKERD